ncbi:hypothetical protein BG011_000041 [Mortierella polycephala]|uniref:F-box domain-containing protein n=1 Tax=Mortierella polycephala TaxID=41804 RepID=A0A9P6UAI4_9FUNG|nr:hypothetical protein BG011_000041 [Mortierella polycephala]
METTTTSPIINPLNLPEILLIIAQFLTRKELSQCVRVSRTWHESFLPKLWETLDFTSVQKAEILHYELALKILANEPSRRSFVKNFVCSIVNIPDFPIKFLNLVSLEVEWRLWRNTKNFIDFVSKHIQSIERLSLSNIRLKVPYNFWDVMLSAHRLSELRLRRFHIHHRHCLQSFWILCSNLEALHISKSNIPIISSPLDEEDSPREAQSFSRLRTMELEDIEGQSLAMQLEWIGICKELESLRWVHRTQQSRFAIVINNFADMALDGKWPKLHSLQIPFTDIQDRDLANILQSMSSVRVLDATRSRLGPLSFQEIRLHFNTIQRLELSKCPSLTSTMLREILQSCPQLRTLVGKTVLCTWDVVESEKCPWVCTRLRELRIDFEFEQSGENQEYDRAMMNIFEKLSALTMLEILDLSSVVRSNNHIQLLLSKGLGQLRSLRHLRLLRINGTKQYMSIEEIQWMKTHWRNLEALEGYMNVSPEKNQELRGMLGWLF